MSEAAAAAPSGGSSTPSAGGQGSGQTQGQQSPGGASAKAQAPAKDAGSKAQEGKETAQGEAPKYFEKKLGSRTIRVQSQEEADTIDQLWKGFHSSRQELSTFKKVLGDADPQEIAQLAKDNDKFAEYLLKKRGIDPDQYSQARLAKMLEAQMMTPEQKAAAEREAKLKEYEQKEKERQEQEEQSRQAQVEAKERGEILQNLFGLLNKSSIPQDELDSGELAYIAARTLGVQLAAQKQGFDWTLEQCVAKVEQDWWTSIPKTLAKLSPEQLEEKLGPDVLRKWRDYDVQRVTGKQASQIQKSAESRPASSAASASKKKGMLSEAEWRESFNKL